MAKAFPFYRQLDAMDCGATCIRMIAEFYGKRYSLQYLREISYLDREGVSLQGIGEAAETIGFRTMAIKIPFRSQDEEQPDFFEVPLPCIVHWKGIHFVVVYKTNARHIWIADPAVGKMKLTHTEFMKKWVSDAGGTGIAMLFETTHDFYAQEGEEIKKTGLSFLLRYMRPYRQLLTQLVLGLLLGTFFQLIFPFLTQAVVDIGIQNQDIDFIYLILIAQLMLFASQTAVQFLQSWILLHIGARVNVSLITDFLIKLMKLPIGYFDKKMIGDLLQRIGDHQRIEQFLTTSSLTVLFSAFNMVVFSGVLWLYNFRIFLIFVIASVLYIAWILMFMKKREKVDYMLFEQRAENQHALIELIQGMQEIKLQNSERKHRFKWANIQAKLFRANIRSLKITQYQDVGATFITQLKDIIITFVAATAVIKGEMTLGMLLAVQYIVGQLNGPLTQFIQFARTAQDARISMERLGEIHQMDDEEIKDGEGAVRMTGSILPEASDLNIENVSFRYNKLSDHVLKDVNLVIPKGKITAIVGTSGSGKTTLVKLLLGFYSPTEGQIKMGGIHLENIPRRQWRSSCGAVMQDGYIFSDTIANNIAESDEDTTRTVDRNRLLKAVKTANIQEFIENLPLGYNTMIGAKGNGLSQGQKQRLLIARAVYKNPDFLYFDEATNSLDAKNERVIMRNLDKFFEGRTVVVVAHRLSTVKNADQIVVLEMGKIVEVGTHQELTNLRGSYYSLVKNQLELGN
ncbi:MAG: ATP-binding cassette subfamily B protein [Saprospiraceae bacterium]|jgi:ATP-binding cassette subfamily B protein